MQKSLFPQKKVNYLIFVLFLIYIFGFTLYNTFAKESHNRTELFSIALDCFQRGNYKESLGYLERLLEIQENESMKDSLFYWMAECYFKENKFEKAKNLYSEIIKNFPNSKYLPHSLYSLGWCLFSESNFKEALDVFQKFLDKFPEDKLAEDTGFKIIECLYNLKDYPKLKESVDLYLTKFPETKNINFLLLYRAEALFYLNMYTEAIQDYQKVVNNSEDLRLKNLACLGLGYSYLKLNKNLEALEEFDRLIESSEDEELILEAYLAKADVLYTMDNYSEAKKIYNKIKRFTKKKFLDRIHYGLGLCLLKENNFFEAKKEFFKVPLESPLYSEAMYLAGFCLYNLNKYKEAYSIFEVILKELKPEKKLIPKIEFYISDCLFRMGEKDLALDKFKKLRIKYFDSEIAPEVLYWLGLYYYKEKEFILAERYFNTIISDFSESKIISSSYYHLAKLSLEQENYQRAKELFLKAIEKDKDSEIFILPDLALIYKKLGEYHLAISSLKRLMELDKSSKDYYLWQFQVAEILQEQKKIEEAVSGYLKIPQESPYFTKALLRVAQIYEDEEKWVDAENIYRKILNLDIPEVKFAKERLEKIKK